MCTMNEKQSSSSYVIIPSQQYQSQCHSELNQINVTTVSQCTQTSGKRV